MAQAMRLNDGNEMPVIGLGTWPMDDKEAERVVAMALELGYRHVDTAVRYGNERGVGRGLAASSVAREDVFVTTKVDGEHQGGDLAATGLRESLDRLGLEYVDLLLIHWPLPDRELYVDTWKTFEKLQEEGLTRSIGVSNFKPKHLERLAQETDTVPAVNQIQLNPYVTRLDHREYHDEHGIVTVSYSPIGKGGEMLGDEAITAIAETHDRTPAQVILRWHLQLGLVPIPKSSNEKRLRENLDIFGFELTPDEMRRLSALDSGGGVDADSTGH